MGTFIDAFEGFEGFEVKSEELSILKMKRILGVGVGTIEPYIAVGLVGAGNGFVLERMVDCLEIVVKVLAFLKLQNDYLL